MPLIPRHRPPSRHGRRYPPSGYGRRQRPSRGGFGMWGPFPSYSRRTRSGAQVSVGGCCLPIPLALALGMGAAARVVRHGRR